MENSSISPHQWLGRVVMIVAIAACLTPWLTSVWGLALGLGVAVIFGNPFGARGVSLSKTWTPRLLQLSVMGLGAGMNLAVIGKVGLHGIGYTIVGIGITFLLGFGLRRALRVDRDASLLITVGTAICGGSAIAAVAPVIRAQARDVSVALGTVFSLNAIALVVFPWIGHRLNLSETSFGLWSALAIHDTSSVVGATLQYGPQALEVGTTVKLARALWIIPVALATGILRSKQGEAEAARAGAAKKPWFILGFLLAAAVVTLIPRLQPIGHHVEGLAKQLMVLTLFLIGSALNVQMLRSVGWRPFAQGFILWLLMASATLAAIFTGLIQ